MFSRELGALALVPLLSAAEVRVWEAPLVIPTYELGPADPNPLFQSGLRTGNFYPYTALDSLTGRRAEKSYRAACLENEYLRVTVLPELGGKLYSIFDKTAGREVLYTNHVVKYGLIGLRGAWTSGGIEWNFPSGHTVTAVSPVDYVLRTEPDGAASITVGDTERIQRMEWAVTIRLRPGWKVVETEVTLNNRREVPGRYWYWANAAARAAEDLRFVYPMREAYPHAFWPVCSFPKNGGIDLGTYREVRHAQSLFARDSRRDFMGIYYEKADHGMVHVADHRMLPGKKTWTWGTDGDVWIGKLTDTDGQYVEFQAGRFETQLEFEFLPPHTVERFTEYWYPVAGLGGAFDEANRNGALHVWRDGGRVRLGISANAAFPDAYISLGVAGQAPFAGAPAPLDPARPYTASFPLPDDAADRPLAVAVLNGSETLLSYRSDTPIDGNPDFKPATPPPPSNVRADSAEEAFERGVSLDKRRQESDAREAYELALKRRHGFAPARLALGISYYRTGEDEKAAEHLTALLAASSGSGEAHYYLGLVRRREHREAEAAAEFDAALRAGFRESLVRAVLGEMAIAGGDFAAALVQLEAAVRLDPRDLKARTYLALAQRLAGQLDRAAAGVSALVAEEPADYLALAEQIAARGKDAAAAVPARKDFWRLLSREPDNALELSFDYMAVGRNAEAAAVLEEAVRRFEYPILNYTLGYLYSLRGDRRRAQACFLEGSAFDPAYVFPHRLEEIEVLRAAVKAIPADAHAAYYLGNALAANIRYGEAAAAWRDAARLDPFNAVAFRNLASLEAANPASIRQATDDYRRAIEAAPEEFHLYSELSALLRSDPAARNKLFEEAPASVRTHSAIARTLASGYLDAGRLEDAARLFDTVEFTAGEGDEGVYGLYRRTHMELAARYRKAGDHARAGAEMMRALACPRNLNVGLPPDAASPRDWLLAAREFDLAAKQEEAEAAARLAAASAPPQTPGVQSYYIALALERLGRTDEARPIYARLAETAGDPLLAGLGLKGLGRLPEARATLKKALAVDPKSDVAREALAELK